MLAGAYKILHVLPCLRGTGSSHQKHAHASLRSVCGGCLCYIHTHGRHTVACCYGCGQRYREREKGPRECMYRTNIGKEPLSVRCIYPGSTASAYLPFFLTRSSLRNKLRMFVEGPSFQSNIHPAFPWLRSRRFSRFAFLLHEKERKREREHCKL